MTVIESISNTIVSLVHVWKSIKKRSSSAKKKIQLRRSTHAQLTIQLGRISLKLSPLIDVTTNAFVWKLCISTPPMLLKILIMAANYLTPIYISSEKKRQLINEHIKGTLVAAIRSPPNTRQECRNVGSMNCNFLVTFIKSLHQSCIKPCLIVHLVALWILIHQFFFS